MAGTITRAALIQAVEAGIAAARGLTVPERTALRIFAVGAEEFSQYFGVLGSGCPLVQTKLYTPGLPERLWDFVSAFDRTVDRALGRPGDYTIVRVTD